MNRANLGISVYDTIIPKSGNINHTINIEFTHYDDYIIYFIKKIFKGAVHIDEISEYNIDEHCFFTKITLKNVDMEYKDKYINILQLIYNKFDRNSSDIKNMIENITSGIEKIMSDGVDDDIDIKSIIDLCLEKINY